MGVTPCEHCGGTSMFITDTIVLSMGMVTRVNVNGVNTRVNHGLEKETTRIMLGCRACGNVTVVEYAQDDVGDVGLRIYKFEAF